MQQIVSCSVDVSAGASALIDVTIARALCAVLNTPTDDSRVTLTLNKEWNRDARDSLRRSIDRAFCRLVPAVDPRRYTAPSSLRFEEQSRGDSNWCASLAVNACAASDSFSAERAYSVEGTVCVQRQREAASLTAMSSEEKLRRRAARHMYQSLACEWVAEGETDFISGVRSTMQWGSPGGRWCHAEPKGIQFTAAIVAYTEFHAVLAVKCGATSVATVAQCPIPSSFAAACQWNKKRSRENECHAVDDELGELAAQLLSPARAHRAFVIIPPAERVWTVEVIAFRCYAAPSTRGQNADAAILLELDDVYGVSPGVRSRNAATAAELVNTLADIHEMLRISCAKARRGREQLEAYCRSSELGAWLVKSMSDVSVGSFQKDKKAARSAEKILAGYYPLLPAQPGAAVDEGSTLSVDESSVVEYKYQASGEQKSSSNRERLRHVLAAFANSYGGYLVVGVDDSGRVVGVSADTAKENAIRTSGFCPTMYGGMVEVTQHRVRPRSSAGKSLPEGWWKTSAASAPTAASSAVQKVVSVLRVVPGTAPFYAPGRYVVPSQRGLASTLRMPVTVCCERLERHLPVVEETHGTSTEAMTALQVKQHVQASTAKRAADDNASETSFKSV